MTNQINVEHEVTLTEGQISTILYTLEGYIAGLDDLVTQDENDKQLIKDVNTIFEVLEGTVDNYYSKLEKAKSKQPVPEWD